jgi:alkylation response protein AidB-like acyl-CoA dehydrogenase
LVVLECGLDEQRSRFLPQIASGTEVFTLAMTEPDYGWDAASVQMRAEAAPGGYVLNGTKLFVQDPMAATRFMCVFKTGDADGDIGIALVDASASGMRRRIMPGFLGWSGEIVFDNVRVAEEDVIVRSGGIWDSLQRAFEKAIPVLCAYKVGGSQAVFDISLAYSQTREQFGQPIGRFQRVQDHIIGIVNHLDAARWATYEALWKLDAGKPAGTSVHLAKAVASEAYYQACNGAHEVHAGVGVSREYGLTLHTRASRTLYHFLGDPKFHRRRLAKVLDL